MSDIKIKDENYVQIQGWMLNKLNLKGNEIMIYALIHGFSQDGQSVFEGSLDYIAAWVNSSRQGVINSLKALLEKGLIEKEVYIKNGVKRVKYWTVKSRENTSQINSGQKSLPATQSTKLTTTQKESGQKSLLPQSTNLTGGSQKSLHNNTLNNNLKNSASSVFENNPDFAEERNSPPTDKEAEESIFSELKKLFGGHFVFDQNFVKEILELSKQFELSKTQILVYLHYVLQKANNKKPNSLTNMYYKMAKSPAVMQDFILSLKADEIPKKLKPICPVCGSEAIINNFCKQCGFEMSDKYNRQKIDIQKKIFALPPDKRKDFDLELQTEISRQNSFGLGAILHNPDLKTEFTERLNEIYKKYGIIA